MCVVLYLNDSPTTDIYTLSLHDALPICERGDCGIRDLRAKSYRGVPAIDQTRGCCGRYWDASGLLHGAFCAAGRRSEEHTSELQSRLHLVCRLLLEKKKNRVNILLW